MPELPEVEIVKHSLDQKIKLKKLNSTSNYFIDHI